MCQVEHTRPYDDQEAIRLHRERLLWGYHEALARLPKGYTMAFSVWIATIGDASTIWKDEHWLNTAIPRSPEYWP